MRKTDPEGMVVERNQRPESEPRNIYEPLINVAVVEALMTQLLKLGEEELAASSRAALDAVQPTVERIARESVAALNGDEDAGFRMRLLLDDPGIDRRASRQLLDRLAPVEIEAARIVFNGDTLLQTIGGNCWGSPDKATSVDTMKRLGTLLEPVFMLERIAHAANAALEGRRDSLNNLSALSLATTRERMRDCKDTKAAATAIMRRHPPRPPKGPDYVSEHIAEWRGEWTAPPWHCLDGGDKVSMCVAPGIGTPHYHVDRLSNPYACPGEVITLFGTNFGEAGEVWFPSVEYDDPAMNGYRGGDEAWAAQPLSWSDTKIVVMVPGWATPGDLHLGCYSIKINGCKTLYLYRPGNTKRFYGGLSKIVELEINGRVIDLDLPMPTLSARPGEWLSVKYRARGGGFLNLVPTHVKMWLEGQIPKDNLPASGTEHLRVPQVTAPTPSAFFIEASGPCGAAQATHIALWITIPAEVSIDWVEVTQGIQEDGHYHQPSMVTTVALKDTAVRVHMYCSREGFFSNRIMMKGTLRVDGRVIPGWEQCLLEGQSYDGDLETTLNFLIPAAWATAGVHHLSIEILVWEQTGHYTVTHPLGWTWKRVNSLTVQTAILPFGGPPSLSDSVLHYATDALAYLPTPLDRLSNLPLTAYPDSEDYRGRFGGADAWDDLLDWMEDEYEDRDLPDNVYWLIVVPAEFALEGPSQEEGGRAGGRAGRPGNVAVAIGHLPETGAHELGHALGLKHVRLPLGDGEPDGPYSTASNNGYHIRPYLEVPRMNLVLPPMGDLMSYLYGVDDGRIVRGPVRSTWEKLINRLVEGW